VTGPRLRPVLDGLPLYKAGARPPDGGFKASSNETPYGPLPSVLDAIEVAARDANRYPDIGCGRLVEALAERFKVPADRIAWGTGSVGLAQQLVQATASVGDEVLFAWRSFEAYPIVTAIAGANPVQVPLDEGDRHDLPAMLDAITERTRLIFVCNPNNPTGTAVGRAALTAFLDAVPEETLVVLDEAYREFVRDPHVPDALHEYGDRPNVCVLRTFSKAYGLAGLRVGFAIAHEPVAAALRKTSVPFGVSSIAEAAAVASLRAEFELLERVALVVSERQRVSEALRAQGWKLPDSDANFVWLRLGAATDAFAQECAEVGLMVRPFSGEGVRATVGEADAGDLLLGVAERFVGTVTQRGHETSA
jgi:histidinol-phosphate aminotransferase